MRKCKNAGTESCVEDPSDKGTLIVHYDEVLVKVTDYWAEC